VAKKISIKKLEFDNVNPESPTYNSQLILTASYVNELVEVKDRKKYALKWISKNMELDIKEVSKMSDTYFDAISKYCYIAENGGVLSNQHVQSLKTQITNQFSIYNRCKNSSVDIEDEPKQKTEEKKGIQDYIKDKAAEVCSEIDFWIDEFVKDPKNCDFKIRDLKKYFSSCDMKPAHYRYVVTFYEKTLAEIIETLEGLDEQLVEGYSHISKPNLKKLQLFLEEIMSVSDHLKKSGNSKPRKAKPVNVSKIASKVKYKKEDTEFDIKSINPVHVVGSQAVWVLNTKTRKIGVYYASDASGLTFKGTSIKNFKTTSTEKTLKKSSKLNVKEFASNTKQARKKKFDEIVSIDVKLNGRINEHCVLLAVDK